MDLCYVLLTYMYFMHSEECGRGYVEWFSFKECLPQWSCWQGIPNRVPYSQKCWRILNTVVGFQIIFVRMPYFLEYFLPISTTV